MLLTSFKGHTLAINTMQVSQCNNYLASCSNDGLVIIWHIQTSRPIAALKVIVVDNSYYAKENIDDPILVLEFYYGQQTYLATASEKGNLYIYPFEDILKCDGGILRT